MNIREKIGERITKSRKKLGITIKELSLRSKNLSAARISNWEQGTRLPGPMEVKTIANILNVAPSYLMCLSDSPNGELRLPNSDSARFIYVQTLDNFSSSRKESKEKNILIGDEITKSILIDHLNKSSKSDHLFATLVEDGSMQPEFNPGDLVVVDANKLPSPGNYVLANLPSKNQTVLRKMAEAENCKYQLLALNPLWTKISVGSDQDALIIGVVVEHRRYL